MIHGDTRTHTVHIGRNRDLWATNARRDPVWRQINHRLALRVLGLLIVEGIAIRIALEFFS